jgi:hypothetical protein
MPPTLRPRRNATGPPSACGKAKPSQRRAPREELVAAHWHVDTGAIRLVLRNTRTWAYVTSAQPAADWPTAKARLAPRIRPKPRVMQLVFYDVDTGIEEQAYAFQTDHLRGVAYRKTAESLAELVIYVEGDVPRIFELDHDLLQSEMGMFDFFDGLQRVLSDKDRRLAANVAIEGIKQLWAPDPATAEDVHRRALLSFGHALTCVCGPEPVVAIDCVMDCYVRLFEERSPSAAVYSLDKIARFAVDTRSLSVPLMRRLLALHPSPEKTEALNRALVLHHLAHAFASALSYRSASTNAPDRPAVQPGRQSAGTRSTGVAWSVSPPGRVVVQINKSVETDDRAVGAGHTSMARARTPRKGSM